MRDGQALRQRLAEMIAAVSDDEVRVDDALTPGASLRALGLNSLGYLRLVDGVDEAFGVDLDLAANPAVLDTVDDLAAHITRSIDADHRIHR